MKVCIECTTAELLDFAELLTYGRGYRNSIEVPKNTDTSRRDVGDDVPNRFREEGVQ